MARKFVVIKSFTDKHDKHKYKGGHFYPREGVELDEARAEELASSENAQKQPLIAEVLTEDALDVARKEGKAEAEAEAKAKEEKAKQKKESTKK